MTTSSIPSSPSDHISSELQPPSQSLPSPTHHEDSSSPSLSTTLLPLVNLLSLCERTLSTLSSTLKDLPSHSTKVQCLYNPYHSIPAESLFNHTLSCSSSPSPQSPSSFLRSAHYPKTLNSREIPLETFPEIDSSSIRISLNTHYNEFFPNYFYSQCPAVACLKDASLFNRELTIPRFLFNECVEGCANAISSDTSFGILPSDLLSLRKDVNELAKVPESYSYSSLCAILRLNLVDDDDLKSWIITHSSSYGVMIDSYMSGHLSLLFRLGLSSIRSEGYMNSKDPKRREFECVLLSQTLSWLSSQFSILYGPENSNSFLLHIFKKCILKAADEAMVSFLGIELSKDPIILPEDDHKKGISLSQVVSAVAALHERYFLEQHLRTLKTSYLPSVQQRLAVYDFECERAYNERRNRDFKAVIEHDGFHGRNMNNQGESNKRKTKEQLMAEERDYKRRRASYKGKKMKRNSIQVMRDLIEEYMEEIKEAC